MYDQLLHADSSCGDIQLNDMCFNLAWSPGENISSGGVTLELCTNLFARGQELFTRNFGAARCSIDILSICLFQ